MSRTKPEKHLSRLAFENWTRWRWPCVILSIVLTFRIFEYVAQAFTKTVPCPVLQISMEKCSRRAGIYEQMN